MFCILITAIYSFSTPYPECHGVFVSQRACDTALMDAARMIKPGDHQGYAFRCVEKGRKS